MILLNINSYALPDISGCKITEILFMICTMMVGLVDGTYAGSW